MSRRNDRIAAVNKIVIAAQNYKSNLVGKTFLFVFEEQYIEAIFKTIHFKHLTGVESFLSAKDFYKHAIKGTLRENQIWFSAEHPYELCNRKLTHLHNISLLTTTDAFLLDKVVTNNKTYKFGATNMDFTICFNHDVDDDDKSIGDIIHAESLRDEDCFSRSSIVYEITHVFSKANNDKKYTNIEFIATGNSISTVTQKIKSMLSSSLLK